MIETKIYDLGWNKDVIFGVDNSKFNNLNETERNLFLAEIAFEVLFKLSENDIAKLNIINLVKNEIAVKQTNTKIFLKEKIFKNFSINLSFKIDPNGEKSLLIIRGITDGKMNAVKAIYKIFPQIVYKKICCCQSSGWLRHQMTECTLTPPYVRVSYTAVRKPSFQSLFTPIETISYFMKRLQIFPFLIYFRKDCVQSFLGCESSDLFIGSLLLSTMTSADFFVLPTRGSEDLAR